MYFEKCFAKYDSEITLTYGMGNLITKNLNTSPMFKYQKSKQTAATRKKE